MKSFLEFISTKFCSFTQRTVYCTRVNTAVVLGRQEFHKTMYRIVNNKYCICLYEPCTNSLFNWLSFTSMSDSCPVLGCIPVSSIPLLFSYWSGTLKSQRFLTLKIVPKESEGKVKCTRKTQVVNCCFAIACSLVSYKNYNYLWWFGMNFIRI